MGRQRIASIPGQLQHLAVVLIGLAAIMIVPVARAGIGDLMKKAKEKASQAVAKKPAAETSAAGKVEFNDVVLELTSERIEHILAAFKAVDQVTAGRLGLVQNQNQANSDRAQLFDKNEEAIRTARNKRDDVERCLQDGYKEAGERRLEEFQKKALTDPVIREKFTRAAQQNNEAAARGDSAAIARTQAVIHEVTAPTREDSARVQKSCGPVPPPLPAEQRLAALDQQLASLAEQIRQIDEKVAKVQANEGGLDQRQWGIALERIQMYLQWRRSKSYSRSATRGFSDTEIESLEKYLAELRATLG